MKATKYSLKRTALLYFAVSFGLALISIVLRTVNLLFFFDTEPGYYISGAVLPILEWVFLGISAVALFAGAFLLFRKRTIAYGKRTPIGVRVGAGIGALGFALLVIADVRARLALAALEETSEGGSATGWIPILLGIGATAYFVLIALNVKNEAARLLTGFCVIVRLLTVLTGSYFNFFVPMNAPDKLMLQLGILCAMLFLINEIRATVASPRPVLYMAFAGIATVFLGAASLPSLIAIYREILGGSTDTCHYVTLLGLFVYVVLRFLFLCLSPKAVEESQEEMKSNTFAETPESADTATESEEMNQIEENKEEQ